MTEYYVSGAVDEYGNVSLVPDDKAQFWGLYIRKADGTSEWVQDFESRKWANLAMAQRIAAEQKGEDNASN